MTQKVFDSNFKNYPFLYLPRILQIVVVSEIYNCKVNFDTFKDLRYLLHLFTSVFMIYFISLPLKTALRLKVQSIF